MTAAPDLAAFELAAEACRAVTVPLDGEHHVADVGFDATAAADRFDYYCANLGSGAACIRIAQHAVEAALDAPLDDASRLAASALGWLAAARSARAFLLRGRQKMSRWSELRLAAEKNGDELVKSILGYHAVLGGDLEDAADTKPTPPVARSPAPRARVLDIDCDLDEIIDRAAASREMDANPSSGVIVILRLPRFGGRFVGLRAKLR